MHIQKLKDLIHQIDSKEFETQIIPCNGRTSRSQQLNLAYKAYEFIFTTQVLTLSQENKRQINLHFESHYQTKPTSLNLNIFGVSYMNQDI